MSFKPFLNIFLLPASIAVLFVSCSTSGSVNSKKKAESSLVDRVTSYRAYLAEDDYTSAISMMANDARRWWGKQSGEGETWIIKEGYSGPWGAWDDHFQTLQKIVDWEEKENSVTLTIRETNDYFRLLERGWVTNEITYYFNDEGLINGLMIRGMGERPPGRTEAFLTWARENEPEELAELMPDGEIDPSGDHPQRFRKLLLKWRKATGLPPTAPDLQESEIHTVYYFIDHGCECRPNEHMEEQKYWFVTTGVFTADSTDLRKIAEQYKQFLKNEYDYDSSVLNNVVVRYQRSRPEASATRSKKIERMKESGYRIIGIDFSPNL